MAQEFLRKWKLSDIWTLLKNGLTAIIKGDFLLRINAGKYFVHIAFTFLLLWIVIFQSLLAESALRKVEKNKDRLHELEIIYADKTFEVAARSRRSQVQQRLQDMGSGLREPEQQTTVLK